MRGIRVWHRHVLAPWNNTQVSILCQSIHDWPDIQAWPGDGTPAAIEFKRGRNDLIEQTGLEHVDLRSHTKAKESPPTLGGPTSPQDYSGNMSNKSSTGRIHQAGKRIGIAMKTMSNSSARSTSNQSSGKTHSGINRGSSHALCMCGLTSRSNFHTQPSRLVQHPSTRYHQPHRLPTLHNR